MEPLDVVDSGIRLDVALKVHVVPFSDVVGVQRGSHLQFHCRSICKESVVSTKTLGCESSLTMDHQTPLVLNGTVREEMVLCSAG